MRKINLIWIIAILLLPLSYSAADEFIAGTEDITQVFPIQTATGSYYFKNASDADVGSYEEVSFQGGGFNLKKAITSGTTGTIVMDYKMVVSDNFAFGGSDFGESPFEISSTANTALFNPLVDGFFSSTFAADGTKYTENMSGTWHRIYIINQGTRWLVYKDCFLWANDTTMHAADRSQIFYGENNGVESNENLTIRISKFNYSTTEEYPPNIGTNCSPMPIPDTTPPEITLINLTSEGGLGYVLFDVNGANHKQNTTFTKTNDTTPTFFVKTDTTATCAVIDFNRDLNWTDIYAGNANLDSGAGTTTHTLTLNVSNQTSVGMRNFSIGCKDSSGNENSTSTSGKFVVNTTDSTPPNITLFQPNNAYWVNEINLSSPLQFNWSAIDNYDSTLQNCSLFIDNNLQFNKTTYANGTRFLANISYSTSGVHDWNVNCTDNFGNINSSPHFSFTIIVQNNATLFLNETHANKSYEYNTVLIDKDYGVLINISVADGINWTLDFDYLGNWTNGTTSRAIYLNLSELNITKFYNGNVSINISTSVNNLTFKLDNNTDIVRIAFKIEGYTSNGFPSEISIDVDNDTKPDIVIPGKVKNDEAEVNRFLYNSIYYNATNITLTATSSVTIRINASTSLANKNFTAYISGYDLDANNEITYYDNFTPALKLINATLSPHTDSVRIFDSFVTNKSGWDRNSVTEPCSLTFDSGKLVLTCTGGGQGYTTYTDSTGDFRNSTSISLLYTTRRSGSGGCGANTYLFATDGTNRVQLSYGATGFATPSSESRPRIINITNSNPSGTTWDVLNNASGSGEMSSGSVSLSSLNFNNQIKFEAFVGSSSGCTSAIDLEEIQWSGAALNYSGTNGTYYANGNYTSRPFTTTTNNISKATLTCYDTKPTGTNINYYLSNSCNGANPSFESITNGVTHIFSATGNTPCMRATFNSSVNTSTPTINKCIFQILKSSPFNVSVDAGSDGDVDWNWPAYINSTNSPKQVNFSLDDFETYKQNNCQDTPTCQYPIGLTVGSAGIVSLDNLSLTQQIKFGNNRSGEIVISNLTRIESLSLWNWTIGFTNGVLKLFDLDVEFKGSKNISLVLRTASNSTNLAGTDSLTLSVYYSKFNISFPSNIVAFNIFATSVNASNLTPFGQSNSTPIFNISNTAYDREFDVYMRANATLNTCLNMTFSNDSSKSNGIKLNTSYQSILTNISLLANNTPLRRINESFTFTVPSASANGSYNITINLSNSPAIGIEVYNNSIFVNNGSGVNWTAFEGEGVVNITNGAFINGTTDLKISYTYSAYNISKSWKGMWGFVDLTNCSRRFIIPGITFRTYCNGCVR